MLGKEKRPQFLGAGSQEKGGNPPSALHPNLFVIPREAENND